METDGTDVDDEDYFSLLPNDTVFVLLESDEQWHFATPGDSMKEIKEVMKCNVKENNLSASPTPAAPIAPPTPATPVAPATPIAPATPTTVTVSGGNNSVRCIASDSFQLPDDNFAPKSGINIADFKKDAYQWNEQSTRIFIELYKHHHELFMQPNIKKKNLWEEISKKMLDYDYEISARQCENKWKSLKLSFKKVEEYNRQSGLKRKCSFYDEISEILGQSNVISISLASTSPACVPEVSDSSPEKTRRFKSKRPRTSECTATDILNWLKANKEEEKRQQEEDRQEMRRMHEEKMKAFYGFLDVLKKWKN